MLAGVAPFVGKTTDELKRKIDSEPPPPLSAFRSDLPPDLEPMILSAIADDPEKRYQSMRSFAEDLQMLAGGVPAPQKAVAAPKTKHMGRRLYSFGRHRFFSRGTYLRNVW